VVTREEGESSLLGFLMRDLRWARGNAQWSNYLLTKKGLPLGPKLFLSIGILCYVWPLLTSVLLVTSVFLLHQGADMVSVEGQASAQLLFGLVATALVVPKALGSARPSVFYGAILGGWLMAPAVMLIQGALFLLGAFGTRWTVRLSRSGAMDFQHVCGLVQIFAPAAALGALLWSLCGGQDGLHGLAALMLQLHLLLLIASPLLATLFSCPWPASVVRQD
jgi:hypothetical protein